MTEILSVEQSFQKLISNLNPTEKQRQLIQTTRNTIDNVLANDNRIFLVTQQQSSFLTGSYKRNTIIRPLDDIDLYVRVHYGKHAENKSPLAILRLMTGALRKRYPNNTKIDVDSPCVVLRFLGYKFEVAPVVGYEGNPDKYLIPAPGSKTWMPCYPNVPSTWLSSCNQTNNGMFFPMIKVLKQWNRTQKIGLKSFHIELLTERVFSAITQIKSYPQSVVDWMYCVKAWIDDNESPFIPEPGNSYKFVDEYLYQNRLLLIRIRRKLERWQKLAERAYDFYSRGRIGTAKRIYSNMFGSMFPAPEPLPASPVLVPPKTEPAPTLKDLPPLQQPTGLLSGLQISALANALANPAPEPPRNSLSDEIVRNALMNMFSEPPKPQSGLLSDFGRNALLDLLSQPDNPFKK